MKAKWLHLTEEEQKHGVEEQVEPIGDDRRVVEAAHTEPEASWLCLSLRRRRALHSKCTVCSLLQNYSKLQLTITHLRLLVVLEVLILECEQSRREHNRERYEAVAVRRERDVPEPHGVQKCLSARPIEFKNSCSTGSFVVL